ncbi:HET-domain-containing protein [Paxillus ammoniavirescens]|nr:HET-domain-containing protein [Paxillus ammoniavirescens]
MDKQRALLNEVFDDFIFNNIPIRLLRLATMQFVDRSTVRQHFKPIIDQVSDEEIKRARSSWQPAESLKDFVRSIVRYAILSHRWFDVGEPTFQQFSNDIGGSGPGYQKLMMFCDKAREYGCEFVWSDTCCIDKTSSAELDESIRSMFRWYRESYVCIVYLRNTSTPEALGDDEWFTRGWTLQELLAPKQIKFYKRDWTPLTKDPNDKRDYPDGLMMTISKILRIPVLDLCYFEPGMWGFSLRQRLSWMSHRKTTRIEDMAYSMVGILDVSLTIAYGEGRRAFSRLLQAIIASNDSWEVFSWAGEASPYNSALAAGPECYPGSSSDEDVTRGFAWVGDLKTMQRQYQAGDKLFTLTNHGLRIKVAWRKVWKVVQDPKGASRFTLSASSLQDVTVEVLGSDSDLHAMYHYDWAPPNAGLSIGILDYDIGGKIDDDRAYTAFLLHHTNDPTDVYQKVATRDVMTVSLNHQWAPYTAGQLTDMWKRERLTEEESGAYVSGIEELESGPKEVYIH